MSNILKEYISCLCHKEYHVKISFKINLRIICLTAAFACVVCSMLVAVADEDNEITCVRGVQCSNKLQWVDTKLTIIHLITTKECI